jgi:hypothetical protein
MTNAELLVEIDNAIQAVTQRGQSYTIDNRSYQRADLNTLYSMRKETIAAVARDDRGGVRTRYGTPTR